MIRKEKYLDSNFPTNLKITLPPPTLTSVVASEKQAYPPLMGRTVVMRQMDDPPPPFRGQLMSFTLLRRIV